MRNENASVQDRTRRPKQPHSRGRDLPPPLRVVRLLTVLMLAVLLVAACGPAQDGGEQAATPTPTGEAAETEDTPTATETEAEATETPTEAEGTEAAGETGTVRVTTLYVCSEAHLAWGIDKGLFAEEGVEIELVRTAGGAAGLAALVAGEADLSSTNPVSAMLAYNQGFPIQLVSNSFDANPEGEGFSEGVVVHADSDIDGPEDLAGRTVAVNEIGSQNDVFTRAWIRQAGVEPMSVNFVALPFPELVPAIQDQRVDAAMVTGSQVAQLEGPGTGRKIGNPLVDVVGPVSIAAYIATEDFVAESPELLQSFVDGLSAAVEEVTDPQNRDEVLRVMSEYCGAPAPALQAVRFPDWNAQIDMDQLGSVADVLLEQGLVREAPDLDGLVAETAL